MKIKPDIARLQYPMENLKMPRSQKNKNQTNPMKGKQEKPPIEKFGGKAPTKLTKKGK